MDSANRLPKFAFAIKKSNISKVPTSADPEGISKLFWSKYKPVPSSSSSSIMSNSTGSQNLYDNRKFQQMLKLEQSLSPLTLKCWQDPTTGHLFTNYKSQQISLSTRQSCFQWLLDISIERESDPNVVFHAMALFDKVLILKDVPLDYAQLLAAAAYLNASKLRETCAITTKELSVFMNKAFKPAEIRKFEVFMLLQLNWDVECATPIPILQVLATSLVCADLVGLMVEKSTDALYRVAASEAFLAFDASHMAAASLLYTMSHLAVSTQVSTVYDTCLAAVSEMLSLEKKTVAGLAYAMKGIIDCETANVTPAKCTSMDTAGISSINQSHLDHDFKSNISPVAPHEMKF